jgi:hypothetical protein
MLQCSSTTFRLLALACRPSIVLRYEREVGDPTLEMCQRLMSRVRRGLHHELLPPLVPLPHEAGISSERLGSRKFLRVAALQEAGLGFAEGRDPALGRDAGAGQRDDAFGVSEGLDQIRWEIWRASEVQPATARSKSFAPSATGTSHSSPEAILLSVQKPRSSSSSPRMAAYKAPERSACLNWPFALRPA